jgi:monofunctional glycosyltransferase
MNIVAQKMRQLSARLKSASELIGQKAISGTRDAQQAWQKARQRPSEWWAARRPIAPRVMSETVSDSWHAAPDTAALPQAPAVEAGWLDRYPRVAKGLRIAGIALMILLALPFPMMLAYRLIDPPFSALMLRHAVLGRGVDQQWVDFQDISPNLATAVIIAEDAAFCRHWGVDWAAVGEALEDLEDGDRPRGASTLPMQTVKNLFLWPEQTYLRKALEVPLAYFMSFIWPKQRVIEVYLNIAEWGPGIFGAEAAARYHFGKSARSLSRSEAALMAAALPSPLKRRAGNPGPQMQRLASRVQGRVDREAQDAACIFDR